MKARTKRENSALKEALAASFKVGNPADAAILAASNESSLPVATGPENAPSPPQTAAEVKKTTVSFHTAEQDHIDKILGALLAARRHRGGFSDAVKIALRLCPLELDTIGRAWDNARAEDRRTAKYRIR